MTATEILAVTRPEDLYPGDLDAARTRYRALAQQWHPDAGGNAIIFAHVAELYRLAVARLQAGTWEGATVIELTPAHPGRTPVRLAIRTSFSFPHGQTLVADESVSHLYEGAVGLSPVVGLFRYASDRMRQEFERYTPRVQRVERLRDGRTWVQYAKTPDLIRLRDLVTHLGTLDPKHCAWLVSSLLNLACYFRWTGVVHHDISPDTIYVSPPHHSAVVLGGWQHAAPRGHSIAVVPARTFAVMPYKARMKKQASTRTDLELIRLTARECLAAPIPEPMGAWLTTVGSGDAVAQYTDWTRVLEATFGPRRFLVMATTADDVYGRPVKAVH